MKLGILQRRSAWPLRKDDMLKHEMVSPLFFFPPPSVHHGPAAWLDPHGQLPPAPTPPPPPPPMCALTTVSVTVTAQWDGASVTRVATYSPPADRSLAHEACSATTTACARCTEVAMVRPHVGACCESECLAHGGQCAQAWACATPGIDLGVGHSWYIRGKCWDSGVMSCSIPVSLPAPSTVPRTGSYHLRVGHHRTMDHAWLKCK